MDRLHKYNNFIKYFKPFEINEGLIKSQDPATAIQLLSKLILGKNIIATIIPNNGTILVNCQQINKEQIVFMFKIISNLGYFVSMYYFNNVWNKFDEECTINILPSISNVDFIIEAKFDVCIKTPDMMYHATEQNYVNKILKIGLTPKSKNKISNHPPRIYLTSTINNAIVFARFAKSIHGNDMTILEINMKEIRPITRFNADVENIKIYKDVNYGKVFYTLDNIPPDLIKDLKMTI